MCGELRLPYFPSHATDLSAKPHHRAAVEADVLLAARLGLNFRPLHAPAIRGQNQRRRRTNELPKRPDRFRHARGRMAAVNGVGIDAESH